MRRSFKFLLRPTSKQAIALTEMLRDHCSLYNGALQERRDAYRHPSKTSINYGMQSAQLKEIRRFDPECQGRWSFPRSRPRCAVWTGRCRRSSAVSKLGRHRDIHGSGVWAGSTLSSSPRTATVRWNSTPHEPVTRVRFQGVGHVRVHQHRPVTGTVKTVSVKREGARWFVILSCDDVPAQPLPATGRTVGIDMGIAHFLTTSDGTHVPNPRHGRTAATELEKAQRALSRCVRGSHRAKKARAKVTALHGRIRRHRVDHAHKTALPLIREFDVIAHEKLAIIKMVRAPIPKPDPDRPGMFLPNGAAAKTGLNRSIQDAGWGVFLGILAHKAESAGRLLIPVDPRNTSRTCPDCGHVSADNRVTQAEFVCVACGYVANADVVGALNIEYRAGLVLREAPTA